MQIKQESYPLQTVPPTIILSLECEIKCEIENPFANEVDEIEADVIQAMLDFAAHEV